MPPRLMISDGDADLDAIIMGTLYDHDSDFIYYAFYFENTGRLLFRG
jgi:hypothetical protein